MAFGDDEILQNGENIGRLQKMYISENVLNISDFCIRKDGYRYYKVVWKPTWEREDFLMACEKSVREFWDRVASKKVKDEMSAPEQSPSPEIKVNSTGRRKSKPKKLINLPDEPILSPEVTSPADRREVGYTIEHPAEMEDECTRYRVNTTPSSLLSRHHVSDDFFPIEEKEVEEYPVMIIPESTMCDSPLEGTQENGNRAELPKRTARCDEDENLTNKNSDFMPVTRLILPKPECPIASTRIPYSFSHIYRENGIDTSSHYRDSSISDVRTTYSLTSNPRFHPYATKSYSPPHLPYSAVDRGYPTDVTKEEQQPPPPPMLLKLSTSPPATKPMQTHTIFKASNGEGKRSIRGISSKGTPTLHVVTETGEHRPQCTECFQTFKKRAALDRHMMIHRGIKPFQCHFCHQRFRQKHHLQGHVMLHTGERPHSCTLCSKKFRMRHHLLEHERISHKVFR